MKKLFLAAFAVFAFASVNAQDEESSALSEGSWVVEANKALVLVNGDTQQIQVLDCIQ